MWKKVSGRMSKQQEKLQIKHEELKDCENFIHTKFGYCFYSLEGKPLIYNLYVHPQYRMHGHSRMLLECVINEIKKTGYDGLIYIQAKPKENSIELSNLKRYYENMELCILNNDTWKLVDK